MYVAYVIYAKGGGSMQRMKLRWAQRYPQKESHFLTESEIQHS